MGCMGKVVIHIPLVTWRDGRPRYFASAVHRHLGYKGEDLRHGKDGPWFTLEEAITWSNARQQDLAEKRAAIANGETTARKISRSAERARAAGLVTVSQLLEHFTDKNPRMIGVAVIDGRKRRKPLQAGTVRGYKASVRLIERFDDGAIWHEPADDLTPKALEGILDKIEIKHGLATARATRAMLSAAYSYGRSKAGGFMVRHNPVAGLETTLPVLEPRIRYGTVQEMVHFVATCDCLGFPEIGDSIVLGLYTGQRQADRLALEDTQISTDGILFRQRKKGGQPLLIPVVEMLRERLEAAQRRRNPWRTNYPNVVLDERTRRPFAADWYRKVFRVLRHAAAFGTLEHVGGTITPQARQFLGNIDILARMLEAGLKPMPSLADFHDQDLRDTAVTWLALAECTKWEIASITGHSLKSIDEILKHYFGMHPELARSGMAKMEKWRRSAR